MEEFYQNIGKQSIDTENQEYEYISNSLKNIENPKAYIENQCSFDEIKEIITKTVAVQYYIANFVKNEILDSELSADTNRALLNDNLLNSIVSLYRDVYITKTHISFYNLKYEAKIVFLYLWQNRMLNKWIMHYILDGTCDNSRSKKNEFYELELNDIEKNTIEQESFVSLIKVLRSSGVYSFPINRHMCEIEKDKNLKAMASIYKVMLVLKNCNNLCRPELVIQ